VRLRKFAASSFSRPELADGDTLSEIAGRCFSGDFVAKAKVEIRFPPGARPHNRGSYEQHEQGAPAVFTKCNAYVLGGAE
jgi:hypothetical protein